MKVNVSPAQSRICRESWLPIILALAALCGCHTPSHPPTFADFHRAFHRRTELTGSLMVAQSSVIQAAALTLKEKQTISAKGNGREIVGAGVQRPISRPLLLRATELSPEDPVTWAALAYVDFDLLQYDRRDFDDLAREFTNAVEKLRLLAPSNSAPLYLAASFQCRLENFAEARKLLLEASRLEVFDNYSVPLQQAIVQADESVGFPHFTARFAAVEYHPGYIVWGFLTRYIREEYPRDEQVLRGCLTLGQRVSSGHSLLEDLVGGMIQLSAMDGIKSQDFSAERAQVMVRQERLKRARLYINSAKTVKVSEQRWIAYYDTCITDGEMKATELLAAENKDTL